MPTTPDMQVLQEKLHAWPPAMGIGTQRSALQHALLNMLRKLFSGGGQTAVSWSPFSALPEIMETPESNPGKRNGRSGRLVVLSNRVALPGLVQAGGVSAALNDALREAGGVWVGWSGKRSPHREPRHLKAGNVDYVTLDLNAEEHRGFYLSHANRALWPLLHSRADLMEHDHDAALTYQQVNRRFAELLKDVIEPDDMIWVHDYHFLPIASELRRMGVRNPLGMFLHTPFPAPDIAQALPQHPDMFGALADFDLIGVQTQRDVDHLRRYLHSLRSPPATVPEIRAFPIGIDPAAMRAHAEHAAQGSAYQQLVESLNDRQLVVGVDRLDYSKGLSRRFQAYGLLFERHPDLLRRVSYLQIAPISRGEVPEYKTLKSRLDALAGAINGRFGDADWVPLRYVARSFKQEQIAGFYRAARVGLVTPLRAGMNLVAKEFVAAQEAHDPGVLVLSEFAGAAEQMQAALLVNPYDQVGIADTLAAALRMPLAERRERWEQLMRGVLEDDVSAWRRAFIVCLETVAQAPPRSATVRTLPVLRERRAAPRLAGSPRAT
jgi:trehalose 6-phosphate synthase